jgi:hypothetical protein
MDENCCSIMHQGPRVFPIALRFSIRFTSVDEDQVHFRQSLNDIRKRVYSITFEEFKLTPRFPQLLPYFVR